MQSISFPIQITGSAALGILESTWAAPAFGEWYPDRETDPVSRVQSK